jgi:hypothetical protein
MRVMSRMATPLKASGPPGGVWRPSTYKAQPTTQTAFNLTVSNPNATNVK